MFDIASIREAARKSIHQANLTSALCVLDECLKSYRPTVTVYYRLELVWCIVDICLVSAWWVLSECLLSEHHELAGQAQLHHHIVDRVLMCACFQVTSVLRRFGQHYGSSPPASCKTVARRNRWKTYRRVAYIQCRTAVSALFNLITANVHRNCNFHITNMVAVAVGYVCMRCILYPVYTIEQTSSKHRANVQQTSSWLVQLTYSQLVEPAWSCKRGTKQLMVASNNTVSARLLRLARALEQWLISGGVWINASRRRSALYRVFTRSSKRPALARVFWIHLLEVCWIV